MHIPTAEQFFSKEDPTKPDVNFLKNHFYREGRVSEEQALYILEKATDILKQEPNLISVDAPVTGEPHVSSIRYTHLTPCHPGLSLRRYPWSIRESLPAFSTLDTHSELITSTT